jgi:hypothetical protein
MICFARTDPNAFLNDLCVFAAAAAAAAAVDVIFAAAPGGAMISNDG